MIVSGTVFIPMPTSPSTVLSQCMSKCQSISTFRILLIIFFLIILFTHFPNSYQELNCLFSPLFFPLNQLLLSFSKFTEGFYGIKKGVKIGIFHWIRNSKCDRWQTRLMTRKLVSISCVFFPRKMPFVVLSAWCNESSWMLLVFTGGLHLSSANLVVWD